MLSNRLFEKIIGFFSENDKNLNVTNKNTLNTKRLRSRKTKYKNIYRKNKKNLTCVCNAVCILYVYVYNIRKYSTSTCVNLFNILYKQR